MEFLRKLFSVCLVSLVLTGHSFAQDSEKKSEDSFSSKNEKITCEEWSCGPNEACVDDKKAGPACQCNDGFTVVNNSCMADECLDSDCPENGFCTADYGFAECGCPEGFYLEEYNGYKYCLFEEFNNETALIIENPAECQSLGLCRVKLNLEFPGSMIDKNSLGSYYITVGESEESYENVPFAGYLTDCINDGFCDDVTAQYITFNMVFPVEGAKEISVDIIGTGNYSINERTSIEVTSIADACDFKTCPDGSWCEVEGDYAYCRGNVPESEGSLSQLMSASEKSKDKKSDGGDILLMGMVEDPQEQFWYHLSESAPGTSSCQNAPSLGGTFCGEYFPFVLPPLVRGVYITPGSTGITRTTSASNFDYMLSSVTVYATITHPYTSDLVIKIISPSGTEKTVFNRVSGTNVVLEVNVTDFNNENPEGTWSIKVVDNYNNPTYVGYLTSWGVKLNSSGYKRINDASTNKRHGSYNGALFETGMISNAVGFEGTDDRIWAGSYIIPDSITVTGWVYPDSVTGVTKEIVHARKWAEAEDPKIRVMIYENKLRAYVNSTYLQSTASISASTWTHIAVSFEKINTTQTRVKIYLNNVLDSEADKTAVAASTQGMWNFGAYLNGDYTYQRFFDGKLDEFRIYNSVLSRYQRDLVYDYGCSTNYYRRSNKTCYNTASCGDGRLTGSEECEDASENDCSATCTYIQNNGLYPTACLNSCENEYYYTTTICGDTYVAGDETCDDGNAVVDICPVYNQSCTVCGDECTSEAGIMEYCGDGIFQADDEECEGSANCTACVCNTGYEPDGNGVCVDVCQSVSCGTHGTCNHSSGYPVCQCDYGYVARNNYCVEGWFEDTNLAAAVVEVLQINGFEIEDELDIDPTYMLDNIRVLDLSSKEISSIVGINLFPDLAAVNLSDNNITDLYSFEQYEPLVSLDLSFNPISDILSLEYVPNLESLNISNTKVNNFSSLYTLSDLSELIISDKDNYLSTISFRPDQTSVEDWIVGINGTDCYKTISIPESIGGKWVAQISNADCSGNGTCIQGVCACYTGYVNYEGNCVPQGPTCLSGYHYKLTASGGICVKNDVPYKCSIPDYAVLVNPEESVYVWDDTQQDFITPAGKTTTSCHYQDTDPACDDSICLWDCAYGLVYLGGNVCEAGAYKDIPEEAYNQFMVPEISRQDVTMEPVPGVPSFAPVLKLKMFYDFSIIANNIKKHELKKGWYLDLPRVELKQELYLSYLSHHGNKWDKKSLTVYMPWGSEQYSLPVKEVCYDVENNNQVESCSSATSHDWKEITFYPTPGQRVFSYVVLKTKIIALSDLSGKNLRNSEEADMWEVTRYGEDGSETKFKRGFLSSVPRPAHYTTMDYIPMESHKTRDNREIKMKYVWEEKFYQPSLSYSHFSLQEVLIIDPAKRAIWIKADNNGNDSGLMGHPDDDMLYSPISGGFDIYTANVDSSDIIIDASKKRVADYSGIENYNMTANVWKLGVIYRTDTYSVDENDVYVLNSYGDDHEKLLGKVNWTFNTVLSGTNDIPTGYTEKRKVSSV